MPTRKEPAVPFETVTVIDGTEYIIHTIFNSKATETAYDKVKRLILNNINGRKYNSVA